MFILLHFFFTMFTNVFEDLTNWHELAVIATCLLIFAGILLIVRKINNKYNYKLQIFLLKKS